MITTEGFVMDVVWVAGIDVDEEGHAAYYFGVRTATFITNV